MECKKILFEDKEVRIVQLFDHEPRKKTLKC